MTMAVNEKVSFISDTGVVQEVEGIEIGVLDGALNWTRLDGYEPQLGERECVSAQREQPKPELAAKPKPAAKPKRAAKKKV